MMRNSRGHMSREEAQARAAESREKHGGRKGNRGDKRHAHDGKPQNGENLQAENAKQQNQNRPRRNHGESNRGNTPRNPEQNSRNLTQNMNSQNAHVENAQARQNTAQNQPHAPQGERRHHRRNRPGSRARRRMRESQNLQ